MSAESSHLHATTEHAGPAVASVWPTNKDAYKILGEIGQGATSIVYKAVCPELKKEPCAIKSINLEKCSNSASIDEMNREISSMRKLKHENIVEYFASIVVESELMIIMDLCQKGSLLDKIRAVQKQRDCTNGVFDEYVIATIMKDVLKGLAYIHNNGLVHRDLKCGNLLANDNGVIQIADFGVAGFLALGGSSMGAGGGGAGGGNQRYTFVGTPCWMAPEVMEQCFPNKEKSVKETKGPVRTGYNQKADIWSIGITAIELAAGCAPYAKYSPMKVLMMTLNYDPPDIDTLATTANQYNAYGIKYRKFLKACLLRDPDQRSTAKDLCSHAFIKSKSKDREHLMRTIFSGDDVPVPLSRHSCVNHQEQRLSSDEKEVKPSSGEWDFTVEGDLVANTKKHKDKCAGCSNPLCDSDSDDEGVVFNAPTSNAAANSATTADLHANPPVHAAVPPVVAVDASQMEPVPTGPCYRITLRKRNKDDPENELQDIGFNFQVGKDTPENLSRELVEAGLIDGTDMLLMAHSLNLLISDRSLQERTFALNSGPAPPNMCDERELHGYAKLMIREGNQPPPPAHGM